MTTRNAPDHPRYDASVKRSPKNVFDREPLLVPQLFEDGPPPWYRRRGGQILIGSSAVFVVAIAVLLYLFGVRATVQGAGNVGASVLGAFANLVGR